MGCQGPHPGAPTSSRSPALPRVSPSTLSGNPHSQLHPVLLSCSQGSVSL